VAHSPAFGWSLVPLSNVLPRPPPGCSPILRSTALLLILLLGYAGVSRADPTAAGMDAYRRGDYATALTKLRPFAERGHGPACVVVGRMYLDGQGVTADAKTAARYFRLGADEADALAASYLADLYTSGNGVPHDSAEAVRLWRKAGHLGESFAEHNLGIEYWHGADVPQDKRLALSWLDAAIADLKKSEESHRAGFVRDRDALAVDMTPEEIESAAQLLTPDGPTDRAVFRGGAGFLDDAYPVEMRRRGDQGHVVLLVLVGADGRVSEARLETSSGFEELDAVTLKRVQSASIAPKIVNGRSVPAWHSVKVIFHLR
jgi:TonB family protein